MKLLPIKQISFQTALLAKNLGFTIEELLDKIHYVYNIKNKILYHNEYGYNPKIFSLNPRIETIAVPSKELLNKWLRDIHNILITIEYWNGACGPHYHYKLTILKGPYKRTEIYGNLIKINKNFDAYEKAMEQGIKKGMEIVKRENSRNNLKH